MKINEHIYQLKQRKEDEGERKRLSLKKGLMVPRRVCPLILTHPHAFKSGEGSEGPQRSQRPQRLDGCEVGIAQRVGDQTDQGDLEERERTEDRTEEGRDGEAEWKKEERRRSVSYQRYRQPERRKAANQS